MSRRLIVTATLALLVLLTTLLPTATQAQGQRCFETTGYGVDDAVQPDLTMSLN